MRTTKTWTVSLPPQLEREAERTAKEEQRSKSDILREALRFYLEERRWRTLQRQTASRAQALGLRTEDDVDALVHELRS
ncbi:MAG: ribbon-helix-helix protein, CopG family [Deltaproteobacteria bacterium]|nr:ribbon-helix-helix protein, CopG family [Deltaproteobacteria bacterium]